MAIERTFSTPLPPPDVWGWISDLEHLAGAMPGLSQVARDDTGLTGKFVLRVGSNQVTYTGQIAITTNDGRARRLSLAATGAGARGSGEASADVQIKVGKDTDGTTVTVTVEPAGSGRIETFDPEALQASGERLLDRFVAAIQEALPTEPEQKSVAAAKPAKLRSVTKSEPAAESGRAAKSEPPAESGRAAKSEPAAMSERAARPKPEPRTEPRGQERDTEPIEHLATVTSISDVVRSRSRARRSAAASALAMVAAVLALWLVHRRNAH